MIFIKIPIQNFERDKTLVFMKNTLIVVPRTLDDLDKYFSAEIFTCHDTEWYVWTSEWIKYYLSTIMVSYVTRLEIFKCCSYVNDWTLKKVWQLVVRLDQEFLYRQQVFYVRPTLSELRYVYGHGWNTKVTPIVTTILYSVNGCVKTVMRYNLYHINPL